AGRGPLDECTRLVALAAGPLLYTHERPDDLSVIPEQCPLRASGLYPVSTRGLDERAYDTAPQPDSKHHHTAGNLAPEDHHRPFNLTYCRRIRGIPLRSVS